MLIIKNKKGSESIATTLLVFLILLVCTSSLFIFITHSKKVNIEILDAGIMNEVQLKQNLAEFYIREASEKAVVESYDEVIKNNEYIKEPTYNLEKNVEFNELNNNLNQIFIEKFKINFKNYKFQEDYLKNLQENISPPFFDGEKLNINVSNFEINEFSEKINVTYYPKISLNIELNKIGLDNFDKIYQIKEECKDEESIEKMENCFKNNLTNFNVKIVEKIISEDEKYFIVNLTSKKEFLINGKFIK
jgi:hypothetical protein